LRSGCFGRSCFSLCHSSSVGSLRSEYLRLCPVEASVPAGWRTSQSGLANFVQNFLLTRLATSFAAFFVLRAILDTVQGGHPLPSILGAMFLLAIQTTLNLINGYNSGASTATADVLDSLWNYLAGTLCPNRRWVGVIGAIWNFVSNKPVLPMVGATLGLLTVSSIWKLITTMM